MSQSSSIIHEIIHFWFGAPNSPQYGHPQPFWFQSTPQQDELIRVRFESLYLQAKENHLNELKETALGTLALILLFDQFPRNMYRNTPQAFATDVQARELTHLALENKFDHEVPSFMRPFFYFPLEHSEDLADQELSIQLFLQLNQPYYFKYAQEHFEVIKHFGRFPHRNKILGRRNTAEEKEFLHLMR